MNCNQASDPRNRTPDSAYLPPNLKKSSLVEFGGGGRPFFGRVTAGCCLGRAWRDRAADGSGGIGSTRSSSGHIDAGIVVKIHLDIAITTTVLYYIIRILYLLVVPQFHSQWDLRSRKTLLSVTPLCPAYILTSKYFISSHIALLKYCSKRSVRVAGS